MQSNIKQFYFYKMDWYFLLSLYCLEPIKRFIPNMGFLYGKEFAILFNVSLIQFQNIKIIVWKRI